MIEGPVTVAAETSMMSVAMALVVLAGLGLALLFKVPALIAASFLLAIIAGVVWSQQGWPFLGGLLRVVGLICLLQVSYLLGLGLAVITRQVRRRWTTDRRRNTT